MYIHKSDLNSLEKLQHQCQILPCHLQIKEQATLDKLRFLGHLIQYLYHYNYVVLSSLLNHLGIKQIERGISFRLDVHHSSFEKNDDCSPANFTQDLIL